jgi:tetratricopeptide (TPR) repeat protein
LALDLDPNHDKASIWLGELLENTKRPSEALGLYLSVSDKSSYDITAKLSAANLYLNKKSDQKALNILQKLNIDKPTAVTQEALGRAYVIRENYINALPVYDGLIHKMTDQELKANPQVLYFRGICYERIGKWDEAEADFKKVLSIDPNHADALNYLGYTWIERGKYLSTSLEMIQKAVELSPNSGAIIDSLGWAYYKLGNLKKAKLNLEAAVELSPTSATIIDHLGDIYWVIGRKKEAMYQWERALNYNPTKKEKNYILEKLDGKFVYQHNDIGVQS